MILVLLCACLLGLFLPQAFAGINLSFEDHASDRLDPPTRPLRPNRLARAMASKVYETRAQTLPENPGVFQ